MKKQSWLICFLLLFSAISGQAQMNPGNSCEEAACSIQGSYSSTQGSSSMGTFGCLYTTPNANWVAINTTTNGSVHYVLTQTNSNGSPIDVDFAVYGPYNSVSQGCPITGSTPTVDCSYSASATEYVDIPHAQAGDVYIILITNYNGSAGTISLTPNANQPSTAEVSCNIDFGGTPSSTPAFCGQPTGSVSVTPNGGTPPYTYVWDIPGNPTTPTVNNLPPGTYSVTITSSPDPVAGTTYNPVTVSVTVANNTPNFTATSTPAACDTGNNGTATVNLSGAPAGVTVSSYEWSDPSGQITQTATGLSPGSYTCTVTLTNGCTGTASVTVGYNNVNTWSSSTLVSCAQGSDGTATANTSAPGTLSYLWNDPAGQTTQTATGLTAGTYTCTVSSSIGCVKDIVVTVTETQGMTANFSTVSNVTCYTKNDGVLAVSVSQGTAPYSYSWDKSASVSNTANDLYVGDNTVTITDSKGCTLAMTKTLTEPEPLKIVSLTPDTQICPEDEITLSVSGTGGSTNHTYTWTSNGVVLGTGTSITVDPDVTNTTYCVKLTEECGSPEADSCMLITFPVPVLPMLTPDKYVDCRPGEFFLQNTSSNIGELATTYIDFGNNTNGILQNGADTSVVYERVGSYTLEVVNTSVYGCVYDTVLVDFLRVNPDPIANFYVGGNPTTIFETTLQAHELASNDVVTWEWISPHSQPSYSSLEDPKFTFPEGVEGIYPVTLIVTSYYGCTDTITLDVIVEEAILFYAPNAFTPDGDEFNQTWKMVLRGGDLYGFNLKVFNRWGEIVWETNNPEVGWDGTYNGKPVPQGMYTWRMSVKHKNDDGKDEHNGVVNVLR